MSEPNNPSKLSAEERARLLGDTRDKSLVEPIPKKPEFYEWLDSLFDGSTEFPEKIETRVVRGTDFERLGPPIGRPIIYAPKSLKPTKEELVKTANELVFHMQRDCDIQRRSVVYGTMASHLSRDTDYYTRYIQRLHPTAVRRDEGVPRIDGDEDSATVDKQFSALVLGHHERLFALYDNGLSGLTDRLDRVMERDQATIEKQGVRIEHLNEMLERAMSLKEEREERRMWAKVKVDAVTRSLDLALNLAPPLLNQIAGKPLLETKDTPETITLRNFLKKTSEGGQLTESQANAAFGDDAGRAGVLSTEQSKLIWDVAQCNVPPDELDKLLIPGPLQVTQQQVIDLATKCGFDPNQLAPVQVLLAARLKKFQGT